jgi:hypothetical protein
VGAVVVVFERDLSSLAKSARVYDSTAVVSFFFSLDSSSCGCWVIDPRGVGASEVVCRHDGSVDIDVI